MSNKNYRGNESFTKKYQKKLRKVTKLIDIITPALVVFERVISGA